VRRQHTKATSEDVRLCLEHKATLVQSRSHCVQRPLPYPQCAPPRTTLPTHSYPVVLDRAQSRLHNQGRHLCPRAILHRVRLGKLPRPMLQQRLVVGGHVVLRDEVGTALGRANTLHPRLPHHLCLLHPRHSHHRKTVSSFTKLHLLSQFG
jgi:hypothetical protein